MTAIVYDGKTIAADTQLMSRKFCIAGYETKILKWKKGIFANAGYTGDTNLFRDWLETDGYKFKPRGAFEAIYTEDGEVYCVDGSLRPEKASIPLGIGSAGEACEILCREGYTAKQAIEAVMKFDRSIGGKVDVVKIDRT